MSLRMYVDEDQRAREMDQKFAYWASVARMDTISAYIQKHCFDAVEDKWRIDEEVFRAGMGVEAVCEKRHSWRQSVF